jgi:hypothetical protein
MVNAQLAPGFVSRDSIFFLSNVKEEMHLIV